MIWVILTFLFFSAVFYSVFAGADFGAGIVEVFGPKNKKRELIQAINKALGPVWEANHMWIILIIVIMQIAFPSLYSQVSIYFHIPITLALFGIILRGCGFAFRYYDPEPEKPENEIFGFIFKFSSFWTPLAYGLVIAGLISGRVDPAANDFFGRFIDPWFSFFGVFVGLFIISLFAFLAAAFLSVEKIDQDLKGFLKNFAIRANIAAVVSGALVFTFGYFQPQNLCELFFKSPLSILSMILATLILVPLWKSLAAGQRTLVRILSSLQVGLVISGWFALKFPNIIFFKGHKNLSFYDGLASEQSLYILGLALLFGSLLIFPALYYLFKVFKFND